jgi:hypothetical protein
MVFSMFSLSFGLLAVLLLNRGWAAPIPGQEKENWRAPTKTENHACRGEHHEIFLSGDFTHPATAARLTLSVGRNAAGEPVSAVITRAVDGAGATVCEAVCQVSRFERYASDLKPAFMDLSCEGNAVASLRMPLQVTWERGKAEPLIRLGSVITGVEEARLKVAVDRYQMPSQKVAELR